MNDDKQNAEVKRSIFGLSPSSDYDRKYTAWPSQEKSLIKDFSHKYDQADRWFEG